MGGCECTGGLLQAGQLDQRLGGDEAARRPDTAGGGRGASRGPDKAGAGRVVALLILPVENRQPALHFRLVFR